MTTEMLRQTAQETLETIAARVAYMVEQSWLMLELLVQPQRRAAREAEAFSRYELLSRHLSILELERFAPQLSKFIPPHAEGRAALFYCIAQKYPILPGQIPTLSKLLHLEAPSVQSALQEHFGTSVEGCFASSSKAESIYNILSAAWDEAISSAADSLRWVSLQRGDELFGIGDPADSLYIIVSGRVRVVAGDASPVAEFGRGQVVGETALFAGKARTASVIALRDSELVKLSRIAFEDLVARFPQVTLQITRTLVERLQKSTNQRTRPQHITNLVLIPLHENVDIDDFAQRLSVAIGKLGKTELLHSSRLGGFVGESASNLEEDSLPQVMSRLDNLESNFQYIIYRADATGTPWTKLCLRQADRILLVGMAGSDPAYTAIEAFIHTQNEPVQHDLVLLHASRDHLPQLTYRWLDVRQVGNHFHVALDGERDFDRLARRLTKSAFGIALGAGGVRGFAHIGVLKALEDAQIYPDLIAGSSAGAIVGGLYAMGNTPQEIQNRLTQLFHKPLDYTLPILALAHGRTITQGMKRLYGDTYCEDLWIEFAAVAANLTTPKVMVQRRGLLWRQVRASASVPGLFPPVVEHGDLLVDGGVFDMVPTDVVNEWNAGGLVVGVDLTEGVAFSNEYNFRAEESGWRLLTNRLYPLARRRVRFPTIVEITARSSMVTMDKSRQTSREYAGVYIQLPLSEFPIFEVKNQQKLVEIGYQHAQNHIPEIQRALRQVNTENWAYT